MAGSNLFATKNTTVDVALTDVSDNAILAKGTVPSAVSGYAVGCIFIETSSGKVYQNTGTTASCTFNAIGDITAGEITLAEGNVLVGNSSGVAAALNGKTSAQILIGNGTTVVSVAVSGDVTISAAGAVTIGNDKVTTVKILDANVTTAKVADNAITRTKMSTAGASKDVPVAPATIATTGNTDGYIIVPETGTLTGVDFSGTDALAAHDTNYITFSITNLGQAGAGSTVLLAATDANTTKATGGTALVANGKRALTLTATGGDLAVTAGDRLLVRAAASGTLANTVTFPAYLLRFGGTT